MTATAATLFYGSETEVIRLAFSCDFLMHGFMSTAALHMAYLNPDQQAKYRYLSVQHQDLALGPFQQATANITLHNCNETFIFAALLGMSQFASFEESTRLFPSTEVATSSGPANWIASLRALMFINHQARTHVASGPLRALILLGRDTENEVVGRTEIPHSEGDESLEHLAQNLLSLHAVKISTTVAEMEAYIESISWLRRLLAVMVETTDTTKHRVLSSLWPILLSEMFIRILREKRPAALVIVAYYCLLLKRCEATWFLEHRASNLLRAVHQSLDDEYIQYLEYPLRIIQGS